ncbi:Cof-type HAD-IIB family hydrolase [Shouchella shacheensis]|uniref:Cof-type HAD-IIB family hydrolase n=1 Tax=Shouchella shacheensis TaxID=1649580 RepID=UPI0007401CC8|nr:Cof-type HAD-IIB family hydrolase [Shouchella shacheensis]
MSNASHATLEQEDAPEIKLIALDMDGTLLNPSHEISAGNRESIAEAQEHGVHVVLSTGRTLMTCGKYAESLNLNSYLVTVNGSEIWHSSGELLWRNVLDRDVIEHIYELHKSADIHVWGATTKDIFRGELPDNPHDHEWMKFGFDTNDDELRASIVDSLRTKGKTEITNSSPTNLEINALGINKASALKRVCQELNLSMDQVMAVGDSLNDIAMIHEAGLGIAMGNAQEAVKEVANWVTATNDQDGVAAAIQRWVVIPRL